jgi:hypothetical protein
MAHTPKRGNTTVKAVNNGMSRPRGKNNVHREESYNFALI